MVTELIDLQLITVIRKPEGGERIEGLQLIKVIWKLEAGERIDRFTADYCDMET